MAHKFKGFSTRFGLLVMKAQSPCAREVIHSSASLLPIQEVDKTLEFHRPHSKPFKKYILGKQTPCIGDETQYAVKTIPCLKGGSPVRFSHDKIYAASIMLVDACFSRGLARGFPLAVTFWRFLRLTKTFLTFHGAELHSSPRYERANLHENLAN
mmetsp:Transcript_13375/g.27186  ORF Transcript_13375/g.27186 Transcript_13375/m.27186 type:complete len:155 (+) Transcript_13375:1143-1607(+)